MTVGEMVVYGSFAFFGMISWVKNRNAMRRGEQLIAPTITSDILTTATLAAWLFIDMSPYHLFWAVPAAWTSGLLWSVFPFSYLGFLAKFFVSAYAPVGWRIVAEEIGPDIPNGATCIAYRAEPPIN